MGKTSFYMTFGICFLALFIVMLLEPSPDKVTFQCDRTKGACIIESTTLFQSKTETINIEDIDHAYYNEPHARGYHGLEIKLTSGSDRQIGTNAMNPFRRKEQKEIDEINNFLSNPALKSLSIAQQRKIPRLVFSTIFLICGILFTYKAMKPYILQGMNNKGNP